AQMDVEFACDVERGRPDGLMLVNVLMRVEVSRIGSHKLAKKIKLAADVVANGGGIGNIGCVELDPLAASYYPLAEIEVKANRERRVGAGVARCLRGRGPEYHQAGASHDAAFEGFDNATVHACGLAEVVGIDDQGSAVAPIRRAACAHVCY